MSNYYFTYWIARYGKDAFKNLADRICQNIKVPVEVIEAIGKDDFLAEYFIIVYCTIALNYFGLNTKQIAFMLDLAITPGTSMAFPPVKILETQKELITEIEGYIRKDLKFYNSRGDKNEI